MNVFFRRSEILFFSALGLLLALAVLAHYQLAVHRVPPIHDASNCVSRTSNIGLLIAHGQWLSVLSWLNKDLNNFLSVFYMGIWNFIAGPGRAAWGWGWIFAFGAWILLFFKNSSAGLHLRILVSIALLICTSALFSREGGIFDQRFDPLAALILCLVAFALLNQMLSLAFLLTLIALFAKGPALPISGALWLSALFSGVLKISALQTEIKTYKKTWLIFASASAFYVYFFLRAVLSYNLMAVNKGIDSHWWSPLLKTVEALSKDFSFYFYELIHTYPGIYLLILGMALTFWKAPKSEKKIGLFGILFWSATYLLFTAHPVRSSVLLVWWVPCTWICCWFISGTLMNGAPWINIRSTHVKALIGIILGITLAVNYQEAAVITDLESRDQRSLNHISDQIVQTLKGQEPKINDALLMVNFLWARSGKIGFNYDALRVQIFEKMGRQSPIIDGWELGTFSDDWKTEALKLRRAEALVLAVVQDPENKVHPFQRGQKIASEVAQAFDISCPPQRSAQENEIIGSLSIYILKSDFSCYH